MKTEDIKKMAQAWKEVQEASYGKKKMEASDTQMGTITVKTDAEREARAKAYRDKKAKNEELKGNQHKIDHNKDGKISAADFKGLRKKAKKDHEVEVQTSESKIDEVSNKTLTNYAKASYNDVLKRRANRPAGQGDESDPKIGKRLAMNKLAHKKGAFKEEVDLSDFTLDELVEFMVSEDFAQLDEISKKTLGSYIKKASDSAAKNKSAADRLSGKAMDAKDRKSAEKYFDASDKGQKKYKNRIAGIAKATDRLTKEEAEQIDEISKKKVNAYRDASHDAFKKQQQSGKPMTPKQKKRYGYDSKAADMAYNKLTGRARVNATEAKDHGNMNNGSPAGEGLSPSAKKELARKTPMPDIVNEPVIDKKTFDAIRASGKKAPMRNNDNAQGDKTPPKGK